MIAKKKIAYIRSNAKKQYNMLEELVSFENELYLFFIRKLDSKELDNSIKQKYKKVIQAFFTKKRIEIINARDASEYFYQKNKLLLEIYRILKTCFNIEGINTITYSFPEFLTFIDPDEMVHYYLVTMGIKYNGTHDKNPKFLGDIDNLENILHYLEIQMSQYICDDFSISLENETEFMRLFKTYINYYFSQRKDTLGLSLKCTISDNPTAVMINGMESYIHECPKLIKSLQETPISEPIKKKTSPQYVPSKPTPEPDLELENRKKAIRELNEHRSRLLEEYLTQDELQLYEQAKKSNNISATLIIKDIDAAIDLMIESTEENRQSLKYEIDTCICQLKEMFMVKEEIVETINSKIVYYKNDDLVPCVLAGILREGKQFYKQILSVFKKFINGNMPSGRQVQGIPYKVYGVQCGNGFSIFYTIINNYVIIIDGFSISKSFDRIKNEVLSDRFKQFYTSIKLMVESETVPNEEGYTQTVLDELEKAKKRKRSID